jgi:RNA polymerase sigma-70 factor (ECF subfamily)
VEDLESFYRREYRSVVGLLLTLCGDWSLAEDLAQDAFTETAGRWHYLANYDKPGAWVRRVAIRRLGRWQQRGYAEQRKLEQLVDLAYDMTNVPTEDVEVWRIVRTLPWRQAQVIALHYQADLGVAEIAETLEISSGAVTAHLANARKTLAERFGDEVNGGS